MESFSVSGNQHLSRFEVTSETKIAFLQYKITGSVISLLHTEVPEEIGGKGIANALADHAFKFAASNEMKVKNYCAFITAYVKKHPELRSFIQENKD